MAWIRQIIMQTSNNNQFCKKESSKIVNFIIIGVGGLMLGRGYINHYCEYALTSTLSICIILIATVLIECNSAKPLLIFLFYDGAAGIEI